MSPDPHPSSSRIARKRNALSVALAVVVVAGIAVVSFLPSHDKRVLHTSGRLHSWGHLLAFTIVGYVAGRASSTRRTRILVFFGALIFGFALEIGEHVVFGSGLEWKDVLVDAFGVVAGTLLALATAPRSAQPETS